MSLRKFLPALLLLAAPAVLLAGPIHTYVSTTGDDANPGSRTAPCKSFAAAVGLTIPKGTVSVLDTGGFGTVSIGNSITIDGAGVDASIEASGVNGIIINAAATDVIILRHLNIQGFSSGTVGIRVVNAAAVYVEDCKISGFDQGISFDSPVPGAQLFVSDTRIVEGNLDGIVLTAGTATIRNCTAAGILNTPASAAGNGFHAGANSRMTIDNCTASGNGFGVLAEGVVYLSNSTITNNTILGLAQTGAGKIISVHNNRVMGNTADGKVTRTIPLR